tara:strand:- start:7136 stop:8623 length:1488 start_codon:yes stop_codon:yes gene_type:complete
MADKIPTAHELRIAQMKRKLDEAIKNLSAPPARELSKKFPPTFSENSLGIDLLGRAHHTFDKYGIYMDEADQLAFRAKLDEAYGFVTDEMIQKAGEQKARTWAKTGPDSATDKWLRMVEKRRGAPADAPGPAGVFARQVREPIPKTRKELREWAAARAAEREIRERDSRKTFGTGWFTPKAPPSFTKFTTTGGGERDFLGRAHIDKLEWRLNEAVSDLLRPAHITEDMGIERIRNLRGELDAALADGLVSQEDHALLQKKVGEAENLITPDMEKRVGERQARRIEKAEKRLAAAEEQLSSATPGTPEHSKAAKRLDAAKKHLKVIGRLAGTAAGVYEANLLAKDIKDHGVLKGTGKYLAESIEGTGQLAQLPEKATGHIKEGWEDMGYTGDSLGTLPPPGVSAADTVAKYVGKAGKGFKWTGDKILKGLGIREPGKPMSLDMEREPEELEELDPSLFFEYDDEDEPEVPLSVTEDRNKAILEASKRALKKGQDLL